MIKVSPKRCSSFDDRWRFLMSPRYDFDLPVAVCASLPLGRPASFGRSLRSRPPATSTRRDLLRVMEHVQQSGAAIALTALHEYHLPASLTNPLLHPGTT
jgi:hypothetical protein